MSSTDGPIQLSLDDPRAPARITIAPDDYQAQLVGTAGDGRRFFITTPFEPGDEYVALFFWSADGEFDSIDVDSFGPRELLSETDVEDALERRIAQLGTFRLEQVSVAPFVAESHGATFGFIPQEFSGHVSVNLMPGDYMSFNEPWDSGEYDT